MLGDLVSGKSFALSLPPASGQYSSSLLFHSKFELYEVFGLFLAKLPVPSSMAEQVVLLALLWAELGCMGGT